MSRVLRTYKLRCANANTLPSQHILTSFEQAIEDEKVLTKVGNYSYLLFKHFFFNLRFLNFWFKFIVDSVPADEALGMATSLSPFLKTLQVSR